MAVSCLFCRCFALLIVFSCDNSFMVSCTLVACCTTQLPSLPTFGWCSPSFRRSVRYLTRSSFPSSTNGRFNLSCSSAHSTLYFLSFAASVLLACRCGLVPCKFTTLLTSDANTLPDGARSAPPLWRVAPESWEAHLPNWPNERPRKFSAD